MLIQFSIFICRTCYEYSACLLHKVPKMIIDKAEFKFSLLYFSIVYQASLMSILHRAIPKYRKIRILYIILKNLKPSLILLIIIKPLQRQVAMLELLIFLLSEFVF